MKRTWWWSGTAVVIAAAVAFGVVQYENVRMNQAQAAAFADKMRLTTMEGSPAPDFTLTDEKGKTVSLSDLRGKVVVLQFMDPVCTDICPVVSSEIVGADKLLGAKNGAVAYVTVNVNQYHEAKQDLLSFSKQHGLASLPNWYFLTGSTEALQAVWKKYGITVVPNPTGDVEHASFMFFIDKSGKEQYVANPDNSQASVNEWSQGIAFYVKRLL